MGTANPEGRRGGPAQSGDETLTRMQNGGSASVSKRSTTREGSTAWTRTIYRLGSAFCLSYIRKLCTPPSHGCRERLKYYVTMDTSLTLLIAEQNLEELLATSGLRSKQRGPHILLACCHQSFGTASCRGTGPEVCPPSGWACSGGSGHPTSSSSGQDVLRQ